MPDKQIPSSLPQNIFLQVLILRRQPSIQAEKRGALLKYLVDLLVEIENKIENLGDAAAAEWPSGDELFSPFYKKFKKKNNEEFDAAGAGKHLAIELRGALKDFYNQPSLPVGITHTFSLSSARGRAYQPEFIELPPAPEPVATSPAPVPSFSDNPEVTFVGNNVQALRYVTKKIEDGELQRIEETFVRLLDRETLYNGSAFSEYCDALKKSDLKYRAVLGPTLDAAIYRPDGLRDALSTRSGDTLTRFYRLNHHAPILNFTLLYHKDPSDPSGRTEKIEALFGYSVHGPDDKVDKTVVFSSWDDRLRNEFVYLFQALIRHSFEIALERPHLFLSSLRRSHVLATYPKFPAQDVLEAIEACGKKAITKSRRAQALKAAKVKKIIRGLGSPRIRICVSAMHFLDTNEFTTALADALQRKDVRVSIALWHPKTAESGFLKLRQQVIKANTDHFVADEIRGNITTLISLTRYENFRFRLCTAPVGSVSLFWIDDFIYFCPYWLGDTIERGRYFMVAACSPTGKVLRQQYKNMLIGAKRVQPGKSIPEF